jgi:CysZ protein
MRSIFCKGFFLPQHKTIPYYFKLLPYGAVLPMKSSTNQQPPKPEWFTLSYSLSFMMRRKRLLGLSLLLFLVTVVLTTAGYELTTRYVDSFAGSFLVDPPSAESIWGWIKYQGWVIGKWLFLIITRIVSFYLAFLIAYCLTSPGYVFLSTAAEKIHSGELFETDEGLSFKSALIDVFEGVKIALFGIIITIVALIVNFIPGLGQGAVFLLYAFYSALMFIDYPASRRRWSLGRKICWIKEHGGSSLRIGLLPALVSMVPVFNVFLMSLLLPLMTIHSTLNFSSVELFKKKALSQTRF